jgi:dehydrogenase/reductase SDR family protein 7B
MVHFENKVVWITGASSGIGMELALLLASIDARVVLSARNESLLNANKLKLKEPDRHFVLPLDLENSDSFDDKVDQVYRKYGRIDCLILSGGMSQRSEVSETPLSIDRRIMEVNYFGNIALTKAVLPIMIQQKSGHFVVISSIAGKFGFFLRSAYSASKHALHGFYESLSLENEQHQIGVTLVCPGKINTNISVNALNATGEAHGVMDHNQAMGMPADQCAKLIVKAVSQKKKEILIGNKEIYAVYIKRFLPNLFWKIIKKQSAT